MQMTDPIKIIECPRDAWQGLAVPIAPEVKADYLRKLILAGFTRIDAVSFVSPAAVPQMADSEQVLAHLMPPEDVEIIGIVVNEKGAERAIRTGSVKTLGFPYSVSSEFLRRNQHQTPEESVDALESIGMLASDAGLNVVAYISMAFGNPYGEPWSIDEVKDACDMLVNSGVQQISLADTVGIATTNRISELIREVIAADFGMELGVHLHSRPAEAETRIRAAFDAGCRRFDAAVGGLGGCPFAQDVLVGNIPTEILIQVLKKCGAAPTNFGPLEDLIQASADIAKRYGTLVQ
jgi:hydroxymethylglutaryl-CoA lyase